MAMAEFCYACNQYRPCACSVKLEFTSKPLPALPTPEESENVVSLTRERFKRDTNPNNHAPRAALEQALGAMDEMQDGKRVTHCIVLFAIETDDGLCGTRFIQAGSADHHGQMGLIAEAQCLLREAE